MVRLFAICVGKVNEGPCQFGELVVCSGDIDGMMDCSKSSFVTHISDADCGSIDKLLDDDQVLLYTSREKALERPH